MANAGTATHSVRSTDSRCGNFFFVFCFLFLFLFSEHPTQTNPPQLVILQMDLTLENITKRLRVQFHSKDSNTNPSTSHSDHVQLLELAQKTWVTDSLFLPGKELIVLDWLVGSLSKSASANSSLQQGDSNSFVSIDHWSFSLSVISHFAAEGASSNSHGSRPSLIPIFQKLFQTINSSFESISSSSEKSSYSLFNKDTNNIDSILEILSLANKIYSTLNFSSSTLLKEFSRCTLDQHLSLAASSIQSLELVSQNCSNEGAIRAIIDFVHNILSSLLKTLNVTSNPKKVKKNQCIIYY
jgi:hypothetical protein